MLIRNPINPYPQNITIDPEKTNISFTFTGDRLGSYKINIYEYSPKGTETLVYETKEQIELTGYKYNNEIIELSSNLSSMNVESGKSYTWEVIMSPYVETFDYLNETFTSLRYYFETAQTPDITTSSSLANVGFLVNGEEKLYSNTANFPHIDIELNKREIEILGFYRNYTNGSNIKYYYFQLFDENKNLIEETDKTFSTKIEYKYSGFLPNQNYELSFIAVSQTEQYINVRFSIQVNYNIIKNTIYSPILTCNENEGNIKIEWTKSLTSLGKANGDYNFDSSKVNIISGKIIYDSVSTLPIYMDKNNFALGIKTKINDNTTKIIKYINNNVVYEVYMKNYCFYLTYGEIDSNLKTTLKCGQFKTNIVFGVQNYSQPREDTGYMMYYDKINNITKNEEDNLLVSTSEEYDYSILLQNKNGIISCEIVRIETISTEA